MTIVYFWGILHIPESLLRASFLARATPKAIFILTVVAAHNTTRRATPKAIFILTVIAVLNTTRRATPKAIFILTVVAVHNSTRRATPKAIFILTVVAVLITMRARNDANKICHFEHAQRRE